LAYLVNVIKERRKKKKGEKKKEGSVQITNDIFVCVSFFFPFPFSNVTLTNWNWNSNSNSNLDKSDVIRFFFVCFKGEKIIVQRK